jgi:DMSO/TMAO reductase YedYZ heme-binding membrane subunit
VITFFLTPLVFLISYIYLSDDIFNKTNYFISSTGYLALIYLTVVLFIPLLKFKSVLLNARSIGLASFYFSLLHFLIYIIGNNFDLTILADDFIYRNYILSGYIALLLFIPMYLTSFKFIKEKIPNWKKIHKIIYIIYLTSLLHIYFIIKADYLYLFTFIMIFLLIITFKLFLNKKI